MLRHRAPVTDLVGLLDTPPRPNELFSQLGVWDTEHNDDVLIYLLLADRDVEIVADRGIHARVGAEGWEAICRSMEAEFRAGCFEQGLLGGIQAVSAELQRHFPGRPGLRVRSVGVLRS